MKIARQFIAVILCIAFVPISAAIGASTVLVGELDDAAFWKHHLNESGVYSVLQNDQALQAAAIEALTSEEPSSDMDVFLEEALVKALLASFSDPEWIEGTTTDIIDEAIPYLFGKRDSLTIQPELVTRVAPALTSLEKSLTSDTFYDIIVTEAWKGLEEDLADLAFPDIPIQISIFEKEFLSVLHNNATKQWYIQTVDVLIDDLEAYLEDQTTTPPSPIDAPFEALVVVLSPQIATVIDTKVERIFSLLSPCSLQQIVDATATNATLDEVGIALITSSSPCVPPGITYPMAKELLNIDLENQVSDLMSEMISDLIDDDMRTNAHGEILDILGPVKCAIHNPPMTDATAITIPDTDTHNPCESKVELHDIHETRIFYLPALRLLHSPWAHVIPVLLAVIVAIIASPQWVGKLRWLSVFAILSGASVLSIGGGLWGIGTQLAVENIPAAISQDYPTILLVSTNFLQSTTHELSTDLIRYGSVIGLGGIALFLIGIVARHRTLRNSSSGRTEEE